MLDLFAVRVILALEKSIKYYIGIKSNRMSLIHTIFDENHNVLLGSIISFNWSANIKETLDKAGYSYIWTRNNIDNFSSVFTVWKLSTVNFFGVFKIHGGHVLLTK